LGVDGNLWLSLDLNIKLPPYQKVEEYLNYGIYFLKEHGLRPISEEALIKYHQERYPEIED
jgi:hypothetical protein